MLAVAHAQQQLIEHAIELQIEIQLAVGVFAFGREDAVVAEPAAGRTPVGGITCRCGIVEADAAAGVPAEAAVVERLDEVLREIVVLGLALAHLSVQAPTLAAEGAAQVQSFGGHLRFAHVVVVDHRAAEWDRIGAGVATGDHAVTDAAKLVHRRHGAGIPGQKAVHRLVVVVEVLIDVQAAQIELQRLAGLELQVDHGAVALAILLEPGRVDRVGYIRIGRHAACGIGESAGRYVAEHFHAAAVDAFFVMLRRHRNAEGLRRVLPAVEQRRVRFALAGLVAVAVADGRSHFVDLQIQRLPRVHQHRAAQAAFGEACFGGFENFRTAQDLRGQQRVIEPAAGLFAIKPDRLRNRMPVQERQIEAGVGAVDTHALALPEAPVQGDAGNLRERFGHVGAWEFADVFGGDRLGYAGVVAFGIERFFQAGADADHLDGIQVGGLRASAVLGLRSECQR